MDDTLGKVQFKDVEQYTDPGMESVGESKVGGALGDEDAQQGVLKPAQAASPPEQKRDTSQQPSEEKTAGVASRARSMAGKLGQQFDKLADKITDGLQKTVKAVKDEANALSGKDATEANAPQKGERHKAGEPHITDEQMSAAERNAGMGGKSNDAQLRNPTGIAEDSLSKPTAGQQPAARTQGGDTASYQNATRDYQSQVSEKLSAAVTTGQGASADARMQSQTRGEAASQAKTTQQTSAAKDTGIAGESMTKPVQPKAQQTAASGIQAQAGKPTAQMQSQTRGESPQAKATQQSQSNPMGKTTTSNINPDVLNAAKATMQNVLAETAPKAPAANLTGDNLSKPTQPLKGPTAQQGGQSPKDGASARPVATASAKPPAKMDAAQVKAAISTARSATNQGVNAPASPKSGATTPPSPAATPAAARPQAKSAGASRG